MTKPYITYQFSHQTGFSGAEIHIGDQAYTLTRKDIDEILFRHLRSQ